MKAFLLLLLVPAFASAQNAVIGYPPDGHSVSPGDNLTVQIQRPVTSEEVAIVIGLQTCAASGGVCASPEYMMGQILYNGPFDPQYRDPTSAPYENFTVQIPSAMEKGLGSDRGDPFDIDCGRSIPDDGGPEQVNHSDCNQRNGWTQLFSSHGHFSF
ncbi:hypothetical protein BKA82DRAFT_4459801 [Pisolithus tinctorius]|nr:hypothetical protein BKA82DRAFT_4459801 [Pisolithus tinctorius]